MDLKFLVFIVFLISIFSCDRIDIENTLFINDPNHPALQNKLKSKREILQGNNAHLDYYYNESGFLTKEETYSGTDLSLTHIYERNQNGQKTKEYSYTGSAPSSIWTFYSYEYENNKLIKQSHFRNRDLDWYIDHLYENNQLVESRKYEDGHLVSISRAEYDLDGRISKYTSYNGAMEFEGAQRYEYKQDTTLIYGINSEGIENPAPYEEIYNDRGQILEEAYLWLPPTGRRVTNRYFYNKEYLLIESHHFDAGVPEAAGPLSISVYEYY